MKTNKFIKGISANGNETLNNRAIIIGRQAKLAQEDLVRNLQTRKTDLELKVDKMTDLSPDSTVSTKPAGRAVDDPKGWVSELHEAKKQIKLLDIEIKIAEDTMKEWFSDEEEVPA